MRFHRFTLLGILFGLAGSAWAAGAATGADALHSSRLDTSVSLRQNFHEVAEGGWKKSHPILTAYPSWGTFNVLQTRTQKKLRSLIEKAANGHPASGSAGQK